ncbi:MULTISPECIES: hypothetical protein [unclassified Serratia (in: enterobacteria)]|uniref:hypothetical protein n=1 Tax=unclassified Serratia (in: enterobacteria) TaxID=2647522 RepID=UPI000506655D|nr:MULTISPECIES: hypothetical protein [unclassified Serratia (in: enterobacteria)]KFK92756.1 hypothetical protein JV45_19620 [Serratia sp. Ag2]KFK96527.1 hypothetical protein IV04_18315 [Serratia sp. Ag1]
MPIHCTQCKQPVSQLNLKQADVVQTPEFSEWIVDLILVCPHCSQQYAAALPSGDLAPMETHNG